MHLARTSAAYVPVRWTTFFFLLAVPLPPILTCACSLASWETNDTRKTKSRGGQPHNLAQR